jgi:hypothetical protein
MKPALLGPLLVCLRRSLSALFFKIFTLHSCETTLVEYKADCRANFKKPARKGEGLPQKRSGDRVIFVFW